MLFAKTLADFVLPLLVGFFPGDLQVFGRFPQAGGACVEIPGTHRVMARFSVGTLQEDCKVKFLTAKDAKDAKSAKEMLARGLLQVFFLGALGVLGGSFCFF